jgi:predicted nucleotidyltransferase
LFGSRARGDARCDSDYDVAVARDMLRRAEQMIALGLNDDVGRAASLACFHVAQAVIFGREGRVLKTHRGVQTEFNRIM